MTTSSTRYLLTALLVASACACPLAAAAPSFPPAQAAPQPSGPQRPSPNAFTIIGKLASFNLNPRGDVEGFMLQSPSGGLVQVNIPYELADPIHKIPLGDSLEASVLPDDQPRPPIDAGPARDGRGPGARDGGPRDGGPRDNPRGRGRGPAPDNGPRGAADPDLAPDFLPQFPTAFVAQPGPDALPPAPPRPPAGPPARPRHPIFRLVSLKDSKGALYTAPQHQPITINSTLTAFNFDPRGELNGLQLANGDFVRVSPQMPDLPLHPNDKLSVQGNALTLPNGSHIIDPETINGQPVRMGPPPPDNGPRRGNPNPRPDPIP